MHELWNHKATIKAYIANAIGCARSALVCSRHRCALRACRYPVYWPTILEDGSLRIVYEFRDKNQETFHQAAATLRANRVPSIRPRFVWEHSQTPAMTGTGDPADDGFTSITWDQAPTSHHAPPGIFTDNERPPLPESVPSSVDRADRRPGAMDGASRDGEHTMPSWGGKWMAIEVREPAKEHEGTKEMYVSYAVRTRVSFRSQNHCKQLRESTNRRILQDFRLLPSQSGEDSKTLYSCEIT